MFPLKRNFVTRLISIFIGIISICTILWLRYIKEYIPIFNISRNDPKTLSFDYIIVGAGTAGSVIAAILSANNKNNTVLIIEAGDTFGWTTKIPLLATFVQKTDNDWGFKTVSQKYSSKGIMNEQQFLPRGKGLGGSSQLNYLLHFNGNPKDFNNWEENYGLTNWNYDLVKEYLDEYPYIEKSKFSVPLNIWELPKNYSLLSEAFHNLKKEFPNENLNFHHTQYTIKNGLRSNVYQIYLQPSFNNENLKIVSKTIVDRVSFNKNKKATSIIFQQYKSNYEINDIEIYAKKEIIISAGCYQTPQILQRSGIGPKNYLDNFNIQTIVDSPNVGENLHDHMNFPLFVSIDKEASITVNKILNPFEIWKYLRSGTGHFSNFGVFGIIDTKNDTYAMSFFGSGSIDEKISLEISNFKKYAFRSLFPLYHNSSQEGFVVLTTCHQPKSRGTVRIHSKNPIDLPLIDPNYLRADEDIDCMIKSIRTAVKIIKSKSFEDLKPKIHWPQLNECTNYGPFEKDFITNQPSDLYIECLIRHVGLGSHHPGGTCAMGSNSLAPLDDKLRVRGVKGLRVIDASILPTPVSGTPNSVLIGLARRAAELILNEN